MNQVALEGKIAEATNPRLMDARRANLRAEAAIPGEVAAQQVKTNASDKPPQQRPRCFAGRS